MPARISEDALRRLRAKRLNERVKLGASFVNTAGLAVLGTAFIVPVITAADDVRWSWLPIGVGLHLIAQSLLQLLKSEE